MTLLCDKPCAVPKCTKERLSDWARAASTTNSSKKHHRWRIDKYILQKTNVVENASKAPFIAENAYTFIRITDDPKRSSSLVLKSQLENEHAAIRPLPIARRKHQLSQRGDPNAPAIAIMPLVAGQPMLPDPADVIEDQQPKGPREKIGVELRQLDAHIEIVKKGL